MPARDTSSIRTDGGSDFNRVYTGRCVRTRFFRDAYMHVLYTLSRSVLPRKDRESIVRCFQSVAMAALTREREKTSRVQVQIQRSMQSI